MSPGIGSLCLAILFLKSYAMGVTYHTFETNYSSECLSSDLVNISHTRQYLVYPDQTLHSIRVPHPDWMSARVVGDIAYILLSEVMGYSTVLFDTGTIFSPHVVN
jgi:hypothetical protein